MALYKYLWRDDPKKKEYASEANLKKAFSEACEPGKHDWSSTFDFGTFDCTKCKARKK